MAQLKMEPVPHLKIERNGFNLSFEKAFDMQQGVLIPTAIYDCVPGDNFNLGIQSLIRTSPLIRPAATFGLKRKSASFFVSYRTLWKDFEKFYSGGRTGDKHYNLPSFSLTSDSDVSVVGSVLDYMDLPIRETSGDFGSHLINAFYLLAYIKIWNDYFRNPTIDVEIDVYEREIYTQGNDTPLKFIEQQYTFEGITTTRIQHFIAWSFAYMRNIIPSTARPRTQPNDKGLYTKYANDPAEYSFNFKYTKDGANYTIPAYMPAFVNLPRDLFTSALPTAQAGIPPSLGLDGSINGLGFGKNSFVDVVTAATGPTTKLGYGAVVGNFDTGVYAPDGYQHVGLSSLNKGDLSGYLPSNIETNVRISGSPSTSNHTGNPLRIFGEQLNKISSGTSSLSISGIYPRELRLIFGLDLRQQLRNLTGNRFKDILYGYYGVTLPDYRLQMAEYIGGSQQDIFTSEVIQTSETSNTPLGSLGGHQISSSSDYHGSYFVREPGCIMNLMWITSQTVYAQGLRRDFRKFHLDDFFFSSFENLGDQEIYKEEVAMYPSTGNLNRSIFGFCPRYSEYKYYDNKICGHLRSTEKFWTQARLFNVDDISSDLGLYLNSSFIKPNLLGLNRIYQSLETNPYSMYNYIVKMVNKTVAFRPMKSNSIGMLIDHF